MTIAPEIYCIEGVKGAGKSTAIRNLVAICQERGWNIKSTAIFQDCNEFAKKKGFSGSAEMAGVDLNANREILAFLQTKIDEAKYEWKVQRNVKPQTPNLLLFDRGWITLHSYIFDFALGQEMTAKTECDNIWKKTLEEAPSSFFIHTRPEVTMKRRQGQLGAAVGLATFSDVKADWEKRMELCVAHQDKIVGIYETFDGPIANLGVEMIKVIDSALGFVVDPVTIRPVHTNSPSRAVLDLHNKLD